MTSVGIGQMADVLAGQKETHKTARLTSGVAPFFCSMSLRHEAIEHMPDHKGKDTIGRL
jgi:hypothetical protein